MSRSVSAEVDEEDLRERWPSATSAVAIGDRVVSVGLGGGL